MAPVLLAFLISASGGAPPGVPTAEETTRELREMCAALRDTADPYYGPAPGRHRDPQGSLKAIGLGRAEAIEGVEIVWPR